MSVVLQPQVEERLRSDKIIWLTTVRPDGRPHSVPVWFLWEVTTILIFSQPKNQKIRNLRHSRCVTLALGDTKSGHNSVVFDGTAELLEQKVESATLQAYGEKYNEALRGISGVNAEQFTTLYAQPIRITPTRLLTW
jgi:PPOX class probable F420-dependent enzyme